MIIYTKDHCDKCKEIKEMLDKNEVKYEEKNSKHHMADLKEFISTNKNILLPIILFGPGDMVSNDQGLYRALKQRKIIK